MMRVFFSHCKFNTFSYLKQLTSIYRIPLSRSIQYTAKGQLSSTIAHRGFTIIALRYRRYRAYATRTWVHSCRVLRSHLAAVALGRQASYPSVLSQKRHLSILRHCLFPLR